jgi:hypothetical protein
LQDAGKISHELMREIAEKKFVAYKKIESTKDIDFDEIALHALENAKSKKNLKKK